MNKLEEVALLHRWISEAPSDSYLASMLRHVSAQFECDSRSDFFTLPDLHKIELEIRAACERHTSVNAEIQMAKGELQRVQQTHRHVTDQLADLRATARRIANA